MSLPEVGNRTVTFLESRKELFSDSMPHTITSRRRTRRLGDSAQSAMTGTASEAAAIQQSLQRTKSLLQQELDRVSHVASTIDQDGKLLDETMNDHKTMNVSKAKKALTALERAQQQERRVLMMSVAFFWFAVFYVMWCRVLIRIPFLDRVLDLVFTSGLNLRAEL